MRLLPAGRLSLALAAALMLAGCDTASDVADSVRTSLAPREAPQERAFTAPPRATYAAAVKALDGIGFRFIRGGPAQGVLEASSRVESGETLSGSRQIALTVHLDPSPDGGTLVTASFREIVEADSDNQAGMATETPLRDSPLYQVYLRGIQESLDAAGAGPASGAGSGPDSSPKN